MCEACGNEEHIGTFSEGLEIGLKTGIQTGISHLEPNDFYYPGLNQYYVETNFNGMQKAVTISPTGIKTKIGEEPVDKYIDDLLDEMKTGLVEGNQREHIANVFKKFSDRKFEDKSWWGDLTEAEINELLLQTRAYWLPHTAMIDAGLAEAYIFGKFSKVLTESDSLATARRKIKNKELSTFDQHRVDYIQKNAKIFWNRAIDRETDTAHMDLLKYNRDVTTEILKDPDRKSWRSLTSDVYHSIKKDENVVLRDLDRIVRTETAYSQNAAILHSGQDAGHKYVFFQVRTTACKICKGMYLNKDGTPKRFLISDILELPRDENWGKKSNEKMVPQLIPHPYCFCRAFTE